MGAVAQLLGHPITNQRSWVRVRHIPIFLCGKTDRQTDRQTYDPRLGGENKSGPRGNKNITFSRLILWGNIIKG